MKLPAKNYRSSWRVVDPATGQAFIICLANEMRLGDVETLGLDKHTSFVCDNGVLVKKVRFFNRGNKTDNY